MDLITRELLLELRDGYEYEGKEEKEYEEKENDIFTFVVSTPEVDRYGTIIVPAGIDYTAYLANPIVLAQHDSGKWPIGRCLGFAMNGENLEATIQIECVTEEGKKLTKLINAGFVKAVSVGIIPVEFEEKTIDGKKITVYTKSELVEFSVVSVPANRQALLKKSIKTLLQESINYYKKEQRMLTPEIEEKINNELLPAIADAVTKELVNLGFSMEEAQGAVTQMITAGAEALFAGLRGGGSVPENQVADQVAEVDQQIAEMADELDDMEEEVTASYYAPETRIGAKLAAKTQEQLNEGLAMIKRGYKLIYQIRENNKEGSNKKGSQHQMEKEKNKIGPPVPFSYNPRRIELNMPKKLTTEDLINLI